MNALWIRSRGRVTDDDPGRLLSSLRKRPDLPAEFKSLAEFRVTT
jgi:hypothetical protein